MENRFEQLKHDIEEFEKCKNDPLYFHNKYVKRPGMKDLTQEEYDRYSGQLIKTRKYGTQMMSEGDFNRVYPCTPDEAFKKLEP